MSISPWERWQKQNGLGHVDDSKYENRMLNFFLVKDFASCALGLNPILNVDSATLTGGIRAASALSDVPDI